MMSASGIGAAVLSLMCPGMGQIMVCNDLRRGIMVLFAFLAAALLTIAVGFATKFQSPIIFGYPSMFFPLVAVWLWNIYDAYTLADKRFI